MVTVHNKGPKSHRDRTILIATYEGMAKEFRPRRRLSASDIAGMTNTQIERAARDLYDAQSISAVNRYAEKMGIVRRHETPWRSRLRLWRARARLCLLRLKAGFALFGEGRTRNAKAH